MRPLWGALGGGQLQYADHQPLRSASPPFQVVQGSGSRRICPMRMSVRRWFAANTLSFCLAIGFSNSESASAAEVYHKKVGDDVNLIFVLGDITSNDEEKFRDLSIKYKNAIVALGSSGGALFPAIEIGKMIRLAGYPTMIVKGAHCTSSCALIWLAGSTRYLSPDGRVGFHAAYRDNSGKMEESGVANAIVGRYLTLLNLSEKAIIFATMASPDKISWLTRSNREDAGIDFTTLESKEKASEVSMPTPRTATPIVGVTPVITSRSPTPPQPRPEVELRNTATGANWIQFTESQTGTVSYYYDESSIIRSGSNVSVWGMEDHSRDRTVRERSSTTLWNYNCNDQTFSAVSYVSYDRNGKVIESGTLPESHRQFEPLVPDSVGMALWTALCVPPDFQRDNPNEVWTIGEPATARPHK